MMRSVYVCVKHAATLLVPLFFIVVLATSNAAVAQVEGQGTLTGTVWAFDMFGNLVPLGGALVVASSDSFTASTNAQADGSYQLTVPPETYNVTVSASPPASNINPSWIDGHVYQSAQNMVPIAGATVTAEPRRVGYDFGASTMTDSSGFFNLTVRTYYPLESSSSLVFISDLFAASADFALTPTDIPVGGGCFPGGAQSDACVFDIRFSHSLYPAVIQTHPILPGQRTHSADTFLGTQTTSTTTTTSETSTSTVSTVSTVWTFSTTTTYGVTVTTTPENLVMHIVSNSSVSGLFFDSNRGILNFTVSGPSGSYGFFNITVAKTLLHGWPIVLVDGVEHSAIVTEDAIFWYVYVTYSHSEHHITLGGAETVPEFPETFSLLLLLATLMISLSFAMRRLPRNEPRYGS